MIKKGLQLYVARLVGSDMASSALDALGLAYDDDDDEDDDEEEEVQQESTTETAKPPTPSAAAVAAAAAAAASTNPAAPRPALPDAANLLSGLPDEVDWDAQSEEDDEPAYDRKGTRYNAVALPSILSQQGEQQSVKMVSLQRRLNEGPAASLSGGATHPKPAGGDTSGAKGAPPSNAPRQAPKASGSSSVLLPPQLRRPNVPTEELSQMRTKRTKPSRS